MLTIRRISCMYFLGRQSAHWSRCIHTICSLEKNTVGQTETHRHWDSKRVCFFLHFSLFFFSSFFGLNGVHFSLPFLYENYQFNIQPLREIDKINIYRNVTCTNITGTLTHMICGCVYERRTRPQNRRSTCVVVVERPQNIQMNSHTANVRIYLSAECVFVIFEYSLTFFLSFFSLFVMLLNSWLRNGTCWVWTYNSRKLHVGHDNKKNTTTNFNWTQQGKK